MRRLLAAALVLFFSCSALLAQQLSIYAIDTEGGKATLIVTPQKESLLVDAGWPFDSRDADRIVAAAKDAGINKIDYLLITHYHIDHVGGVPWLFQRMPVAHVIDHGATIEHDSHGEQLYAAYRRATRNTPHIAVEPGDSIPLKGVAIRVVSTAGALLKNDAAGQSENPLCRGAVTKPAENDENDQSIGIVLSFGKFRMVDLADLTWGREHDLVCPANLLGKADVFMVSHHGLDRSNSPLLVGSLKPRAAIMDNGALKGGSAAVVRTFYASPGFQDLWELHAIRGGETNNAPEKFIANTEPACLGFGLKLTATADGAFIITNQRTGYSVTYAAK
jgi:competence protein ComEC